MARFEGELIETGGRFGGVLVGQALPKVAGVIPRRQPREDVDTDLEAFGQNIAEVGKGVIPGAIQLGGTALKGVAAGVVGAERYEFELADTLRRARDMAPEQIREARLKALRQLPTGSAVKFNMALSGVLGGDDPEEAIKQHYPGTVGVEPPKVAESSIYEAGEAVGRFGQELIPAAPGYEQSLGRQLGEGLGSVVAGAAVSMVPGVGPALAATTFSFAGSGEAVERAVQAGATEEQIIEAARLGVFPGMTDSLPIEVLTGRIPLPGGKLIKIAAENLGPALRVAGRVGWQAVVEGLQEGGQAWLQNLIARDVHTPEQSLTEGVLPEAGLGAGVGAIVGALATPFRRRGGRTATPEAAQPEPTAAETEQPTDRIAAPEQQPPVAETQQPQAPTATAVEPGLEIATTGKPTPTRPQVITPEQVLEVRAKPRFKGHAILETEGTAIGPGVPGERAEPFRRPQAQTETEATPAPPKSRKRPVRQKPLTLAEFLALNGGVKDETGELTAMDAQLWHHPRQGGKPFRRRLVHEGGLSPDYAREAAAEAGYLPMDSDLGDFYTTLDRDLRDANVYSDQDTGAVEDQRAKAAALAQRDQIHDAALGLGIPQESIDRLGDFDLSMAVFREMEVRAEQENRDFDGNLAEYDIDRYVEDIPDDTGDFESRTLAAAAPVSQEDAEAPEPLAGGQEEAAGPDRDAGSSRTDAGAGGQVTDGSPEYEAAYQESSAASRKFSSTAEAYQAGKISDEDFTAAQVEHAAAQKKFDEAETAERKSPTTEQTDQGEQIVIPGAERTTGKEFVEAQADKRIKGTKAQKPADEGLFDVDEQGEIDLHSGINLEAAQKQWGKIADRVWDYIADLKWAQKLTKGYPFHDPFMAGLGKEGKQKFLDMRNEAMGRAWRMEQLANHLGKVLDGATDVEAKAVLEYLTTKGASPNTIPHRPVMVRQRGRVFKKKPTSLRNTAVAAKSMIKKMGKELVRRGMISQDSFDKYNDEYLPRVYMKHLMERHSGIGGSGLKIGPQDYTKERIEDLPKEYRDLYLGEIKDAGFLVRRSLSVPAMDMAMQDFLHDVAGNPEWVLPESFVEWKPPGIKGTRKVTPYWLKAEAAALRDRSRRVDDKDQAKGMHELAEEMDAQAEEGFGKLGQGGLPADVVSQYEELPDSPRYGDLRGALVRKDIVNDIVGSRRIILGEETVLDKGLEATRVLHAFWKMAKVPLNIPTVVRNFTSNMILMHIGGDVRNPPLRMIQALREIRTNGKYYRIALKHGVPASTFKHGELADVQKDLLRLKGEAQGGMLGWGYKAGSALAGKLEGAADFYQFLETWGKTAVIIDQMRRGATEQEAVAKAQEALFDYSAVPNWLKQARRSPIGAPFVTFFYKALPAMLRGASRHPGRAFLYYAIPYMLGEAIVKALQDVDDDDIEALLKALPEWMHTKGLVMLWPVQDEKGRWQPVDLSYFLPWGAHEQAARSVAKIATGEMEEGGLELFRDFGIFGGPAPQVAIAVTTGIDTFTGRPIVEETDSPRVQVIKKLNYAWRLGAPTWLTDMGFTGHMYRSLTDQPNYRGDPPLTVTQAAARLVGINIYPIDPEQTRERNLARMRWEIKSVMRARRRLSRNHSLTENEKEIRREEYDEMRQHLIDRRDEYEKTSKVHPRLRIGAQRRPR